MYTKQKNSVEGIFETYTINEIVIPFLSISTIQSFRDGDPKNKLQGLRDAEIETINRLLETINRIDVLKPFLAENIEKFCKKLHGFKETLKKTPTEEADKQSYLTELKELLRTCLKDEGEEKIISETRFAIMETIYTDLTENKKTEIIMADVIKFGSQNILGMFKDMIRLLAKFGMNNFDISSIDQSLQKIDAHLQRDIPSENAKEVEELTLQLVLESGDSMTKKLREIAQVLSGEYHVDTSGGDEFLGVAKKEPDSNSDEENKKDESKKNMPFRKRTMKINLGEKIDPTLEFIAKLLADLITMTNYMFSQSKGDKTEIPTTVDVNVT